MLGVASAEVAVLIADNSENPEKREFLKEIRRINPNVIAISHERDLGSINNFYYLLEWSKNVEFVAMMGDDDWMSPTYHLDAYRALLDNSSASGAEVGTTFVDIGDGKFVKVNQPPMCGRTPIERIAQWNGMVARVTTYNASRRATLETALQFLKATPLLGMTLIEDLFELNRLAMGDFLSISGHGCFVHYPATASCLGDQNKRFYDLLYKDAGLPYEFVYFTGLSTAIQCAMFLMGSCSPIVDPVQKSICGQYVFRQTYLEGFLPAVSGESAQDAVAILFTNYPAVMDGFSTYCTPPYSQQPIFDSGLIDWFVLLLDAFEQKALANEFSISVRFRRFIDAIEPYDK
jgi:hypothetical protein